jgi:hypothetical protein
MAPAGPGGAGSSRRTTSERYMAAFAASLKSCSAQVRGGLAVVIRACNFATVGAPASHNTLTGARSRAGAILLRTGISCARSR